MTHAWSMVGGAITPGKPLRPGRLVVDVDRVLVAHGVDQCRIIAWLTSSRASMGGPLGMPSKARSFASSASASVSVSVSVSAVPPSGATGLTVAARVMPRPAMATISRWISLTPPPKVLIWAWRAVRSSRPASTAPGESGER